MDYINVDLQEIGKGSLDLAQDNDMWRDFRISLKKFLWNGGKFLTSLETVNSRL